MPKENLLDFILLRSIGLTKRFRNKRIVISRPPKDLCWWEWKAGNLNY